MTSPTFAQRAGRAELRADGLAVHLAHLARTELLAPLAAAVWQAADGRTDLAGLLAAARTVEPTATTARLWQVLDVLGDADLLTARLAPPGPSLDRRAWLRTLAATSVSAVAVLATYGGAAQAKKKKHDEAHSEQNAKKAERNRAAADPGGDGAAGDAPARNAPGDRAHAERSRQAEEQAKGRAEAQAKRRAVDQPDREQEAKAAPNAGRKREAEVKRDRAQGDRDQQERNREEASKNPPRGDDEAGQRPAGNEAAQQRAAEQRVKAEATRDRKR